MEKDEITSLPLLPLLERQAVTRLLSAWRAGDSSALQQLTPLVYEELRLLAKRYMRKERTGHTLQATAVVHEAFVRMIDLNIPWQDRGHFYAVAATLMRRILVDHAKTRRREKRGGTVTLHRLESELGQNHGPVTKGELDVLEIDQALERLASKDARLAQTLELYYFAGLTYPEIAQALGVSETTVNRDMRLAKAWMLRQIKRPGRDSSDFE